jgi:signal transduction histidine kinase/putative methionine-R-sulfoxide reductase with GAF domain
MLAATGRVAELEAALAREQRIARALRKVGVALGSTLDLDDLLGLILKKITEALEADRATLYLLDAERQELVSRIVHGERVLNIRLKVGEGIAGEVARTGHALLVRDAQKDHRFSSHWDDLSGYRTRSILAAPMKTSAGETIGVVQVLNKKNGEFSKIDEELLLALATHAAVSIDNSRLLLSLRERNSQLLLTKEQLEHRVRDLHLLFDLERSMSHASSVEDLLAGVLGSAARATSARAAAAVLVDGGQGGSLYRWGDKAKPIVREPWGGGGYLARALETRETVCVPAPKQRIKRLPFELPSALIVPFEGEDGEMGGVIALYGKRGERAFSPEDRDLLQLVAANASTAIRLQRSRELREQEERLSTIGRLLSGVIHDLKTPLTIISGYVQLMQDTGGQAQREHYAQLALKQFDLMGNMQREVLEFARGERSVLVRKVYLQKFFEDVRNQIEPELRRRNVRLVIDLHERGTARFDESKVTRIVHNMARNAAEALGVKGGTFSIEITRRANKALVMRFSDTGPGIPKAIAPRLFQSFVTSGKEGGTGLGLAIVKKVAEDHGGEVSLIDSSSGACFELVLPQP